MTEAGPGTLKRLIESNLWDEARVIQSKTILGKGLAAPFAGGYLTESFVHGGDQISIYRNKQ
jgi:riboflavin biosynthesis pyrimidine reductase